MGKLEFGVIDAETDPFVFGRVPRPFAWEILLPDGGKYVTWGKNATDKIIEYLHDLPRIELYAHNGGKFDMHFLIPYVLPQQIMIINGRIAKLQIGKVTITDSYLLVPIALEQYKKTKIDYRKFEAGAREKHKREILSYLHDDCRDLLELMQGMIERLGKKLTVGGAAMYDLKKMGYEISRQGIEHDALFRPFYYGGRVEALQKGYWKNCELQYIDINSAYPHAMRSPHPYGAKYFTDDKLPPRKKLGPQFAIIEAISNGCLPVRDGIKLQFPRDDVVRTYYATGHEIAAGLDTGTLEIINVRACYTPVLLQDYSRFVDLHYNERKKKKEAGDKIGELADKLLMNSAYGKFASNPEHHREYYLMPRTFLPENDWDYEYDIPGTDFILWSEPAERKEFSYYDVAIAASITGAVRAKLWRALCAVREPYYCDTDSIICTDSGSLIVHSNNIGDWKLEGIINSYACAGRKLYAAKIDGEWKTATKGSRIDYKAVIAVAQGKRVKWQNDAPTFSLQKGCHFVEREITRK